MNKLTVANKAWIAALITALTTFVATVQGRTDLDTMGAVDWLIVVVSAIVAGLTVYSVPNTDPVTTPKLEENDHFTTE
jgi:hypothetical protein